MKYVAILGNPAVGGIRYVGPFETYDDAYVIIEQNGEGTVAQLLEVPNAA